MAAKRQITPDQLIRQHAGLDEPISEIEGIISHDYLDGNLLSDKDYNRFLEWLSCRKFYRGLRHELGQVHLSC